MACRRPAASARARAGAASLHALALVAAGRAAAADGVGATPADDAPRDAASGTPASRPDAPPASPRGGLPKAVIGGVIKAHADEARACFETELRGDPDLSGKLSVRFVIGPTGAVTSVEVTTDSVGAKGLAPCVTSRVREWVFPAPEGGGQVVVTYPWIFRVARGPRAPLVVEGNRTARELEHALAERVAEQRRCRELARPNLRVAARLEVALRVTEAGAVEDVAVRTDELAPGASRCFVELVGSLAPGKASTPGEARVRIGFEVSPLAPQPGAARPGHFTIEPPGALTKVALGGVMAAHDDEVLGCFSEQLGRDPNSFGLLRPAWVVGPSGAVEEVAFAEDTVSAPQFAACFAERMRGWRFSAPPGGGPVRVTFPWVFLYRPSQQAELHVEGNRDSTEVRLALARRAAEQRACTRIALGHAPRDGALLLARFRVHADGRIADVEVVRDELPADASRCFAAMLSSTSLARAVWAGEARASVGFEVHVPEEAPPPVRLWGRRVQAGLAEEALPLRPGTLQAELGGAISPEDLALPAALRYGASDALELAAELEAGLEQAPGLAGAFLSVRGQLLHAQRDRPGLALRPYVALPAPRGRAHAAPGAVLATSMPLPGGLWLHGSVGGELSIALGRDATAEATPGLALEVPLSGRIAAVAGAASRHLGRAPETVAGGGFRWALVGGLAVDASAEAGLSRAAAPFALRAGVGWAFDT